jgi:hypothetical protein
MHASLQKFILWIKVGLRQFWSMFHGQPLVGRICCSYYFCVSCDIAEMDAYSVWLIHCRHFIKVIEVILLVVYQIGGVCKPCRVVYWRRWSSAHHSSVRPLKLLTLFLIHNVTRSVKKLANPGMTLFSSWVVPVTELGC